MALADTADLWPEEKCIQLIREFRKRPILWDQKDPTYYKKAIKLNAWNDVGKALNVSAESCTHKMVILMSSFRREKAKVVNSFKYGKDSTTTYHSSWFGFKEMSFLMDKDSERKRKAMGISDEDDDFSLSYKKYYLAKMNKFNQKPPSEDNEPNITHRKMPKISEKDEHIIQVQPALEQQSRLPQHNEDEIKYFSNFIASKMMKYNEKTKNAVQQAICEVIFKADMNDYEPKLKENCTKPCEDEPVNPPSDMMLDPSSSGVSSVKVYYSDSD